MNCDKNVRKGAKVTFTGGMKQQWTTCTISPAHAGDNYIIAAHPNDGVIARAEIDSSNNIAVPVWVEVPPGGSGGSYMSYKPLMKSAMLTVWRTLHVEYDYLQNAAGQFAELPGLGGLPTDQYNRACIELLYHMQPITSISIAPFDGIHHLLNQGEIPAINAKRYSPPPSNSFWTVHLIGAFYRYDSGGKQLGIGGWSPYSLPSTSFVFIEAAEWQVYDACPNYPDKLALAYLYKQWLIAHEIGHVMGCGDTLSACIMYGGPNANMSPDNLYKDPNFLKFRDEDIRAMQATQKPE